MPGVNIKAERNVLMESIISQINEISNEDLISIIKIPTIASEYSGFIMNNDKAELEFKIAIISELIVRIAESQIEGNLLKVENLTYLEEQLTNKLNQGTRFKLRPYTELTSAISSPVFQASQMVAGPAQSSQLRLLHDSNRNFSCYLNSTLFGLFHKKDNPMINMIKVSDVKLNQVMKTEGLSKCNNMLLKTDLIEYYRKMHNEIQHPFPTNKIRQFFQECLYTNRNIKYSRNYWTNNQLDNTEFLYILLNLFNFKPHNNGFALFTSQQITNPVNPANPPIIIREPNLVKDAEYPIYTMDIKVMNRLTIDNIQRGTEIENIKVPINNGFIIQGVDIHHDQKNLIIQMLPDFSDAEYRTRREDNIFINPNMFILNVNRTTQLPNGEFGKCKNAIIIQFQINIFNLCSIVVHHGETLLAGHYTCYFKNDEKWYLMNDLEKTIKPVDIQNVTIMKFITTNCTTLIYYP